VLIAHRLWQHTRLNGSPIQEHIDPMLSAPSVQGVIPLAHPSTPPIDPKASDRTPQPDSPPTGPPA
jgi:hypothetical protein